MMSIRALCSTMAATLTFGTAPLAAQRAVPPAVPAAAAPYASYTAFQCVAIAGRRWSDDNGDQIFSWRDRWPATAATDRADSLAHVAVDSAIARETQACLAAHTVDNIPAYDVAGLGLGRLTAHDDAGAVAAFGHVLAHEGATSVTARAWWLRKLMQTALEAGPERFPLAVDYLKQLDALGAMAFGYRLTAHNKMYQAAVGLDSLPLLQSEARAIHALRAAMAGNTLRAWLMDAVEGVMNEADAAGRMGHPEESIRLLSQADSLYVPLDPDRLRWTFQEQIQLKYQLFGKPARPIKAAVVFTPGKATSDTGTTHPTPGKVSFIVNMDYHGVGPSAVALVNMIRQAVEHGGDRFETTITAMAATVMDGHLLADPAVDAPRAQTFLHDYMHVPAVVAVALPRQTGKLPDGRLTWEGDPNAYPYLSSILVDKHGRIRSANLTNKRLLHMIDELSREP